MHSTLWDWKKMAALLSIIAVGCVECVQQPIWTVFKDHYSEISQTYSKGTTSYLVNSVHAGLSQLLDRYHTCHKDLGVFFTDLQERKGWALRMLDASTHTQSGFLEGNIADLGNFDECLAVENTNEHFHGKMCEVMFFNGSDRQLPPTISRNYITSALCVPSSCTERDLSQILLNGLTLNRTQFAVYNCLTRDNYLKPYNFLQLSIITFFVMIVVLVLISTVYDVLRVRGVTEYSGDGSETLLKPSPTNKEVSTAKGILLSFSLYSNGISLLKTDTKSDSVKPLHGLRCFAACGVLTVHRHLLDPQNFTNMFLFDKEMRKWYRMVVFNAYIWVDVFFLMSGMLVSYNFFIRSDKKRKLQVWRMYLHRYLRLTPTLAVVILMYLMTECFCEGLHCRYLSYIYSLNCKTNWWLTLTYLNNIIDQHNMCILPSWYLSADMQMFLFSPILLYVLMRWPRLIFFELSLFYVISKAYVFTVAYIYRLIPTFIGSSDYFTKDSELIYNQSYGRIGPWLLGFGLGILLQRYNENPTSISKAAVRIGWILSVIACLGAFFGIAPFVQTDYVPRPIIDSLCKALYRDVWALGFAWIIYACYTGHGGWVNRFLSCPFFHPLSRLTYSFYLIHTIGQFFIFKNARAPRYYSDITQFSVFVGDIQISLILAVILHLLIEAPSINLERVLFNKKNGSHGADEPRRTVVKEA